MKRVSHLFLLRLTRLTRWKGTAPNTVSDREPAMRVVCFALGNLCYLCRVSIFYSLAYGNFGGSQ